MQNLLDQTINLAGQTTNNTAITAMCAHLLNTHTIANWPQVHAATIDILLRRLNFPNLPTTPLTPATLASFVEDAAQIMPEPEVDDEIDLDQPRRHRHRRYDDDDEEEDDSIVVSDDVIEYEEDSSSSSSFELKHKKTRR